jgi:hypothetical protein
MSIHTPSTVVIPAHEHLILNVVGIVLYGALGNVYYNTKFSDIEFIFYFFGNNFVFQVMKP